VRKLLVVAVLAVLVVGVLALAAAGYEAWTLGASLARLVKDPRGPRVLTGSTRRERAPRGGGSESAPAEPATEPTYATVSFTVTQEDLGRFLGRRDRWLAGALSVTRVVSCRLAGGRIALATDNRLQLLGLTIAGYPGASDWSLRPVQSGLGVRLNELRLLGIAIPGASRLVQRLGRQEDGWIVVSTGSRNRIERIEAADGRLSVSGTVRGRT
jgi:hypothetical protein